MANIRIKCAQIVQTVLEDKVFFGDFKTQIAAKDLPFANMLILTALRHWVGLNRLLDSFLNKKIPNKHRAARYLILLAMTELLFMQTAPYAVINETVKNVRQTTDLFLSRLSNAVLRQVAAQAEELRQKLAGESHLPEDFTAILSGYDAATIKQIDDCITNIPALDLSVKENPQIWAKKLSAELLPSGSLRLSANANVPLLQGYHEGAWWVQDAAAALPVLALGNVAGKKVADLCAAPGGKTAQLAAKGADITAIDISADRLKTLQQNMQRIGFEKVQTFCADAIDFLQKTPEQFDALLLDAPCSATGTFRRHPEVLHLKTIADVQAQALLQRQILDRCASALKIGGILVYSVCSITRTEGEQQIKTFLEQNKSFRLIPISAAEISPFGTWKAPLITSEGFVRTLPFYHGGMDSFFICKMQRII